MRIVHSGIKKFAALMFTVFGASLISLIASPALRAQTEGYLQQIAANTYGTLAAVNNIPSYLSPLTEMALAWVKPDTTDTTAKLQGTMAKFTNDSIQNMSTQSSLQPQILKDFFGPDVNEKTLPYANDLSYQTLIGFPFFAKDPRENANPAYNYILNASGARVSHPMVGPSWTGTRASILKYLNYYQSINAVQTYDAYILSSLYANYQNGSDLTKQEVDLYTQASSSDWFAKIASDNIGVVLRRILMFNSQMYLIMVQSLETQKQLLAAQVMNNTLMVLMNQSNEEILVRRGTGQMRE